MIEWTLSLFFLGGIVHIITVSFNTTIVHAVIVSCSLVPAVLARITLGHNWSGARQVISTGLYGVVVHPIYLSVTLAAFVSAVFAGHGPGFVGTAMVLTSCALKAWIEERELAKIILGR